MTASAGQSDAGREVRFWRGQVWPRRSSLVKHRHVLISLAVGSTVTFLAWRVPIGDLRISTLATAGLGYAALSFGACITGSVLVLSLPSREQIRLWARTRLEGRTHSNASDLLFVFTWAAAAQLGVVLTVCSAYLLGGDIAFAPSNPRLGHIVCVFISSCVAAYAFLCLSTVVSTISQVGTVTFNAAARQDLD